MELIEIEKIVSPEYNLGNYHDGTLAPGEIRELRGIVERMQTEYDEARRNAWRPSRLSGPLSGRSGSCSRLYAASAR